MLFSLFPASSGVGVKTFYPKNREEWRAWLGKNGRSAKEIWLVYYKKGSGRPRVPYDDAVEEALCFGWVDGVVRKMDAERYVQRFSPRRGASQWSELNIRRARKMIRAERMTVHGLAVFDPARKRAPHPTKLPSLLEQQFKKAAQAWENFQNFPPSYRRMAIAWVASAKKEETRRRRLQQLIDFSAQKKRIKFM